MVMGKARQVELMISLHKKVDVGALSDEQWREYQRERQEMEDELKKLRRVNTMESNRTQEAAKAKEEPK